MKPITIFSIIILSTALILGATTNTAFAQDDPSILSKIAKRAQEKIQNQITNFTSDETKTLFEDGKKGILALETALSNEDLALAKQEFLSTMKIFAQVSHQLASNQSSQIEPSTNPTTLDPSNDLLRMKSYVTSLKAVAENHNSTVEFSPLDKLFTIANAQIKSHQYAKATNTIQEIKNTIVQLNEELRTQTSQQESNRAQIFANKYLQQIDRILDHGKKTGMSEEIVLKLENAKESLLLALSPADIIKEVRNILLIQNQFGISETNLLDLRISNSEQKILEISNSGQFTQNTIQGMNKNIETIKNHMDKQEFEQASELLKALETILEKIKV